MNGEPDTPFETATPIAVFPRSLPSAVEAESALLGCCLIDETMTADMALARGVTQRTFSDHNNRLIWSVVEQLRGSKEPATSHSIAAALQGQGRFTPELASVIFSLADKAPTTSAASSVLTSVLEMERRRNAAQAARILLDAAEDLTSDLDSALAEAQIRLRPASCRSAEPFQLWPLSQFIAYQSDPSACLLGAGFVEKGEWTSLVGIGGIGKTRFALYFSICQVLRRDFCGLTTSGEPQNIVILSTENGVRRWKQDATKLYSTLDSFQVAITDKFIRVQALTADDDGDLNLGNPDTIQRLEATLKASNPGLVIFDPFADMVDGDENKTADLILTLRSLRRVHRNSCPTAAILIIHHARTGSQNVLQAGDNYNAGNFGRGSKALYSRVRCELQLAPQDRDDPNRLVLACGKANNAEKFVTRGVAFNPETFTYSVDEGFNLEEWRDDVSGKRRKSDFSIKTIVEIITENSTFSGQEVEFSKILTDSSVTGVSKSTVVRTMRQALDGDYVRKGKSRGTWVLGSKPISEL